MTCAPTRGVAATAFEQLAIDLGECSSAQPLTPQQRIAEIPLEARCLAAWRIAKDEHDVPGREAILAAALWPAGGAA